MFTWILTLLFGTGATITPEPIDIAAGEVFVAAPRDLMPVRDGMRVFLSMGMAAADEKEAVLSGSLKLSDIGNIEVAVCTSRSACVVLQPGGTYLSNEDYGFEFQASGAQLKGSRFIGVKVTVDRPLSGIVVSWSNYVQ